MALSKEQDLSGEFSPRSSRRYRERELIPEPCHETSQYIVSDEKFSSDEKVNEFIDKLREKNQNYYMRDYKYKSRLKNEDRRNANSAVIYNNITYSCIFGTKERSKGQGIRETKYVFCIFTYL